MSLKTFSLLGLLALALWLLYPRAPQDNAREATDSPLVAKSGRDSLTRHAPSREQVIPPAPVPRPTLGPATAPAQDAAPSPTDPLSPEAALDKHGYEQLAQRARSGDGSAARRLHQQLRLCELLAHASLDAAYARVERRRPGAEAHPHIGELDRLIKSEAGSACLRQQRCAELPVTDQTEWLLAAARAGDVDAQTAFAEGMFLQQPA